ncbi:hypothetical protein PYJP_00290 [Pyrofollis japonicus]|uniref:hypothetical protein n=1 Tax=Pyrofollis japonicus TaxID=3060460 RepID=UPI00295B5F44|nr:hypothetical protein [Pyrofollis japonicus]BEP16677.1 hypothetical protein PYJP_00290 [Pyrofollis japonicus]
MSISLTEKRVLPLIEPEEPVVSETDKKIEELRSEVEEVRAEVKSFQSIIDAYSASLSLYEARVSKLEAFQRIAAMVGAWKSQTCVYNENGVCKLWRLSEEAAKQIGEEYVKKEGEVYRVVVSKAPWFCGLCPLYKAVVAERKNS